MTPSSRAKGRNRSAPRKKLVEMTNSCICCTLRDDLLSEVRRLAGEGRFDYLLIKSTGIAEPLHIIGEEARARNADLIVMGAHRRGCCVTFHRHHDRTRDPHRRSSRAEGQCRRRRALAQDLRRNRPFNNLGQAARKAHSLGLLAGPR
jgi:hypothetical protein